MCCNMNIKIQRSHTFFLFMSNMFRFPYLCTVSVQTSHNAYGISGIELYTGPQFTTLSTYRHFAVMSPSCLYLLRKYFKSPHPVPMGIRNHAARYAERGLVYVCRLYSIIGSCYIRFLLSVLFIRNFFITNQM